MDFTMQLLAPQIRTVLPLLVVLFVTALACGLTWLITSVTLNASWRVRIRDTLPVLWKEQLDQEKARADAAERRAEAAEADRDALSVAVRGARKMLELPNLWPPREVRASDR